MRSFCTTAMVHHMTGSFRNMRVYNAAKSWRSTINQDIQVQVCYHDGCLVLYQELEQQLHLLLLQACQAPSQLGGMCCI